MGLGYDIIITFLLHNVKSLLHNVSQNIALWVSVLKIYLCVQDMKECF